MDSRAWYQFLDIDRQIRMRRQLQALSTFGYHKPIPNCPTVHALQRMPYNVYPTAVDFLSIYVILNVNVFFCSIFHMDTISPYPYALQRKPYSVCPTAYALQMRTIIVYMQLCSIPEVHRLVGCITK